MRTLLPQLLLFILLQHSVCMESDASRGRLLIHLLPWKSHAAVAIKITTELVNLGYDCTILSEERFLGFVDSLVSARVTTGDRHRLQVLTYHGLDLEKIAADVIEKSPIEVIEFLVSTALTNANKILGNSTIMGILKTTKFDLLLGDITDTSRIIFVCLLNIHHVDINTGAADVASGEAAYGSKYSPSYIPAYTSGLPQGPYNFLDRVKNFVLAKAVNIFGHIACARVTSFMNALGINDTFTNASRRGVVITITSADFLSIVPRPASPFEKYVGPLLPEPAKPLPEWLWSQLESNDGSEVRVVLVSPGSSMWFGGKACYGLLKALHKLTSGCTTPDIGVVEGTSTGQCVVGAGPRYKIVWKLSQSQRASLESEQEGAALLQAMEASGLLISLAWMPQNDLLGLGSGAVADSDVEALSVRSNSDGAASVRTVLFVSHCGINGINEALFHGVPVLCLPITADQPDNGALLRHMGVGDYLHKHVWEAGDVSVFHAALNSFLCEEGTGEVGSCAGTGYRRRAWVLSRRLRCHPRTPVQQAAEWVQYAHRLVTIQRQFPEKDFSSLLKPVGAELSWAVEAGVDVRLFLLVVLAAVVVLVLWVLRWIWRSIFRGRVV